MKTTPIFLAPIHPQASVSAIAAAVALLFATGISAIAADAAASATATEPAISSTNAAASTEVPPVPPTPVLEPAAPPAAEPPAPAVAAAPAETSGANLRLNFRNAPLNLVLDYLSDAAGFIINKETEVRGTVDAWSKDPVTKDEAITLLNSNLRKNGYGVVRDGRILTIIALDSIKTDPNLPVSVGSDPNLFDGSDEVVTQIIPVRYANATQLMNNLQLLLPTSATLSVNESANSLLVVATKRDIRRMLKIVGALDTSIASVSSIKVFQLHYADAKQLASEIQQLFQPQGSQGGQGGGFRAQLFNMMRGGGGFPGGQGGPGGSSGSSGGGAGSKVTAAADDYSNSLIVSASPEVMATITEMVQQIDVPTTEVTELRVFHLTRADPVEIADQLSQLFPDSSRSSDNTGQNFGFRFFGGGGRFGGANAQATSSDRTKKKSQVIAVPDPRTSSVLVAAAAELMPHIAEMIQQLESTRGRPEVVSNFELQYADPQDVQQVLQDLFNRQNTMRQNNNNTRSLLGQNNPLTSRATSTQNTYNNMSSGFGNTRGGGGMNTGF
jgi:general secretion pathway protein D